MGACYVADLVWIKQARKGNLINLQESTHMRILYTYVLRSKLEFLIIFSRSGL